MPIFYLDNKEVSFNEGETILQVAWREGIFIPVFCFHPHLPVFAGCRVCLVEVETKRGRTLVPSCATQASEGIRVFTDTEKVREARAGQLEFLLLNHPIECPVCDAGGECDLQNIVYRFGKTTSRFFFEKRKRERKYAGPFLELYPNRCIVCYRCVSFYRDIAGGDDWGTLKRGNETLVGPLKPGPLESEFSGNMIEVCPLGAITGRDYRFSSRPWEHKEFNSISPHDSIGANTRVFARVGGPFGRGPVITGGKRGEWHHILRVNIRVNPDVNGPWIDDRTRFTHGFVDSRDRLKEPLLKRDDTLRAVSWDEAIEKAILGLKNIRETYGPQSIGMLTVGRGTNESAFLFAKLAREGIFTQNVDSRPTYGHSSLDPVFEILGSSISTAVIKDIEESDLIVVFGVDIKNRFPLLGLNLMSAQKKGSDIALIFPYLDKASGRWATRHVEALPNEYEKIAFAFTKEISDILGISVEIKGDFLSDKIDREELKDLADVFVRAKKPLLIFSDDLPYETQKALSLASVLKGESAVLYLRMYPNGQGFVDAGVHPSLLTGQRPSAFLGKSTLSMLESLKEGDMKGLILLRVDPLSEFPNRDLTEQALKKAEFVLILDSFETKSTRFGDAVLPLATFYEEEGTYTNTEGRVQYAGKILDPLGISRPAVEVLKDLLSGFDVTINGGPKELFESMKEENLIYKDIDYGQVKIKEEAFPLEIPSLRGIKKVFRTPLATYPRVKKIGTLSLSEIEGEGEFVIHRGYRLFKSRCTTRSPLPREIDGGVGLGISPEDAKALGIGRGDWIIVEGEKGKVRTPIFVNEYLPKGVLEGVWPFTDFPLNRFIGIRGFGWVRLKTTIPKEAK